MSKAPDLRELFGPPDEVVDAASDGGLVLFVGSGVSMLHGLPSWRKLAEYVLEDLREAGLLNYSEIEQLRVLDPRKQLSIAKLIAKENGRDTSFAQHFPLDTQTTGICESLNSIGCTCVTTNYDELIAPRFKATEDGSTIPATGARVSQVSELYSHLLDKPGNVVHLHGVVSNPGTMIVTMEEYLHHYDDERVQEFLRALFARRTVVFVGYGLEEAEILEYIFRRGDTRRGPTKRRFALQGFFRSEQPLYEKLHAYYEHTFGVHLLGFLRDHQDYKTQENIIESWVDKLNVRAPTLVEDATLLDEVFPNG